MYISQGFRAFPESTPQAQNTSPAAIEAFREAIFHVQGHIRGFCLVQNGNIIAQEYFAPYEREDRVWVYSISKSFTSTAVGMAIDEGLLSEEDPVISFFPESLPAEIPEHLRVMRVKDLLSMSTGHETDTTLPVLTSPDGDWIKTFLSLPVEHAPNTHFLYNTGASFMLSAIVQKVTGQKLMDYLAPRLFAPLGFDSVEWDESPRGINTGGWGISVRLEDLAKLGQLYLDHGVYQGKQIVSSEWVAKATSFQSDNSKTDNQAADWTKGYGYQFWMCQHNAFRADGAAGQFCVVMPEQNAVLTLMSETLQMQSILDALWTLLLPKIGKMTQPTETEISGQSYLLEDNAFGFKKVDFTFGKDTAKLVFTGDHGAHTLEAGRGNWHYGETTVPLGFRAIIPMFAQAKQPKRISAWYSWLSPDSLEISWVYRDTPHRDKLLLTFSGNGVEIICPPSDAALFKRQGIQRLVGTKEKQ
jgi:CubicO group peptidase (beta-lactamase class C family)